LNGSEASRGLIDDVIEESLITSVGCALSMSGRQQRARQVARPRRANTVVQQFFRTFVTVARSGSLFIFHVITAKPRDSLTGRSPGRSAFVTPRPPALPG
jgi:hypothetical protein